MLSPAFNDSFRAQLVPAYQTQGRPIDFGTIHKWRKGESNPMRVVLKDLSAAVPAAPSAR